MGIIDKDAFEQLEQKMVENQDLSRVVEGLKQDVESEIGGDKTISQYNLERELNSRARTIESAFSSALAQADNVQEDFAELEQRTKEDRFQDLMDRDAVDAEDMENALDIIDQYQQLVSRLVLVLKIYRDDRQLLRSGIDIQQTRANESEVMEMAKDLMESGQTEFKSMGKEMADEFAERLDRKLDDRVDRSEEQKEWLEGMKSTAEELNKTAEELKEARQTPQKQVVETRSRSEAAGNSSPDSTADVEDPDSDTAEQDSGQQSKDAEDHPNLSDIQTELYTLVDNNPEKDIEWYAEQMDYEPGMLKSWRTKIQKREGYEDFSLE